MLPFTRVDENDSPLDGPQPEPSERSARFAIEKLNLDEEFGFEQNAGGYDRRSSGVSRSS
jgi:hypothetical protein